MSSSVQNMTASEFSKKKRISALDSLRGGAMVLVVIYHILYDLAYIFDVSIPRFLIPGEPEIELVRTCFLWVLFAISGICSGFSRSSLKRGAILCLAGYALTVTTSLFAPSQLIVFGVLSCFGVCMVLAELLRPLLNKIPWQVLFISSVLLWLIFSDFHRGGVIHLIFTDVTLIKDTALEYLYPLGIRSVDFHSADYFPVIPYMFMFFAGNALLCPISQRRLPARFYDIKPGVLAFIGKHSLLIYALHQPIILAVLEILF